MCLLGELSLGTARQGRDVAAVEDRRGGSVARVSTDAILPRPSGLSMDAHSSSPPLGGGGGGG